VGYPQKISLLESATCSLFSFDLFATQLRPGRRRFPVAPGAATPLVVLWCPIPGRAATSTLLARRGRVDDDRHGEKNAQSP
jgi:hypothetical protein